MPSSAAPSGRIVLVPTPIGNLGDITLRAIETLRTADRIACEDTRHSAPLLSHLGISGKPLIALHEHNENRRAPELAAAALAGETIAVITDAGMPGVSDPGYRLVQACLEAGVPLEVLPGPSAVITALIGSGFPCHAFHFGGFLPVKSGKRRSALAAALASGITHLFFESPHRLLSTLTILADLSPSASVCVARELTKKFETYHRGTAAGLLAHFETHPPKGEIVLVLRGAADASNSGTHTASQCAGNS
ncbi:MAG: 16S rRNA (cytidine(1402)-2'-O)-methyltransferase [Akkermansiaceae bacterium]|jgi:16S rRNA (cytidine1402-2'-O)-methyltransferase|nr:16S rRNA (cytidine(1402)-2'-O)-methyltransferase [Akkermansiaceae bacterium]